MATEKAPKIKATKGEIWNSFRAMQAITAQKFPVMVSYRLAKLAKMLEIEITAINEARKNLINQYSTKNAAGKEELPDTIVDLDADCKPKLDKEGKEIKIGNPAKIAFNDEWQKFIDNKDEIGLDFEMVKIPQMVASTCDACHHNMDRPLEIEPWILMLLMKFVEVV